MVNNLYGGTDYANQVPNFRDDNVHNFLDAHRRIMVFSTIPTSLTAHGQGRMELKCLRPTRPMRFIIPRRALGGRDLTTQRTENACWFRHGSNLGSAFGDPCTGNHTYWPITYFIYNGGSRTVRGNYTKIEITTATPAGQNFTSPGGRYPHTQRGNSEFRELVPVPPLAHTDLARGNRSGLHSNAGPGKSRFCGHQPARSAHQRSRRLRYRRSNNLLRQHV